jgi:hypothetical protein
VTTTPADELRAAAETLRALARAALGNCRPWRHAKGLPNDSVRTETGWEVAHGDDPNNLRYIAAMHPGIGLALADLLADQADGDDEGEINPWALAVARAINAA